MSKIIAIFMEISWTESKRLASLACMRKRIPKRSATSFKDYIKFMVVALVLLFIVDQFLLSGERPYVNKIKQGYAREKAQEQQVIEELLPPAIVYPEEGEYFEAPILPE
ncbi:MAG: hypothetical protein MRY79_01580 [Alphaproteobacteria bacterium]|nr:hypothetical protein [Alphaproteobacteria bacterium]